LYFCTSEESKLSGKNLHIEWRIDGTFLPLFLHLSPSFPPLFAPPYISDFGLNVRNKTGNMHSWCSVRRQQIKYQEAQAASVAPACL
jgi:hypothetical protein